MALQAEAIDESNEWETFHHIPDSWLPIPLFQVRNVPIKAGVTEADVKEAIERTDPNLKVKSVYFDERPKESLINRRTAFVRLKPLRPSKVTVEPPKAEAVLSPEVLQAINNGPETIAIKEAKIRVAIAKVVPPTSGDANQFSQWAVTRLKTQQPPVLVGGEKVQFEIGAPQVQLYIGNLSPDWQQDQAFEKAMATYGAIERVFIVRNSRGLSKGYGFVEYQLPGPALRCKQAMDEIERDMRPDPRAAKSQDRRTPAEKGKITEAQKAAGWQEGGGVVIKLLRAEWAQIHLLDVVFSRVLYVANLRTSPGSQKQLKDLFSQYGEVEEVSVPKNKQTNTTKGFAFVLFKSGLSADRAYRALEQSGTADIGGALVSFANAAKHSEAKATNPNANAVKPQLPFKRQAPGPGRQEPGVGRGPPVGRFGGPGPIVNQGFHGGAGFEGRGGPGMGMSMGPGPGLLPPMGPELGMPMNPMHQQIQMQNEMQAAAAQSALQEQMRLQQAQAQNQMQAQFQAQMQAQQQQMQQLQEQLEASQRQIQEVTAKAQAEAEARLKLEAEARQAAAAAAAAARAPAASRAMYAGASRAEGASSRRSGGSAYAGYEAGYGGAEAGLPPAPGSYGGSQGQAGYDGYGPEGNGYAAHEYERYGSHSSAGAGDPHYESRYADRYGPSSGYGYDEGYGRSMEPSHGGYGGAGDYGAEYGSSRGGYPGGEAYSGRREYGGSYSSGSKRGAAYQGYGGGGGSGYGDPNKRQRY